MCSLSIFPNNNKREQIWPCCKIGQCQARVIIWTNLVLFWEPMPHTKFQGHQPFGSREKCFKGFYHIWTWRPSWLCDINRFNSLSFPYPMEAPHEIWLQSAWWFLRKKFENGEPEWHWTFDIIDTGSFWKTRFWPWVVMSSCAQLF